MRVVSTETAALSGVVRGTLLHDGHPAATAATAATLEELAGRFRAQAADAASGHSRPQGAGPALEREPRPHSGRLAGVQA